MRCVTVHQNSSLLCQLSLAQSVDSGHLYTSSPGTGEVCLCIPETMPAPTQAIFICSTIFSCTWGSKFPSSSHTDFYQRQLDLAGRAASALSSMGFTHSCLSSFPLQIMNRFCRCHNMEAWLRNTRGKARDRGLDPGKGQTAARHVN